MRVGPPLLARGPSCRLTLSRSPVAPNPLPPVAFPIRLCPREVKLPETSGPLPAAELLAMRVFRSCEEPPMPPPLPGLPVLPLWVPSYPEPLDPPPAAELPAIVQLIIVPPP